MLTGGAAVHLVVAAALGTARQHRHHWTEPVDRLDLGPLMYCEVFGYVQGLRSGLVEGLQVPGCFA